MLRIKSLRQVFNAGSVNEICAIKNIDLVVPEGQFVTIIGSNGAGKSTLFNIIAGVYLPTEGHIEIDGVDVSNWAEHRRAVFVGRVFQNPLMGTAASMTIAENLTLALLRSRPLRLRTGVTKNRRAMLKEILAPLELGLENRLDTRVALLSGGQRQAMTLLMASLAKPKLLLLDEHTAALDPATAVKILSQTRKIIDDQKLTALMITHNMKQALEYGDRTLMMDEGQIILDLNAEEKATMTVQELVDKFTMVRHRQLLDDKLLLSM